MFNTCHIIFLIVDILLVIGMCILTKKFNWGEKILLKVMFYLAIVSEVVVFLFNFFEVEEGSGFYYLSPTEMPLHLCGMALLFFIGLGSIWKNNEKMKDLIVGYLWLPGILGACLSLILGPTIFVDYSFNNPQIYEYNIWHSMLVFFGIQTLIQKWVVIDGKRLRTNMCLLLGLSYFAIMYNSFLQGKVSENGYVNYYFLAGAPAGNSLPILNTKHGYIVYLVHLIIVVFGIFALAHLPFIIKNKKNKKTSEEE